MTKAQASGDPDRQADQDKAATALAAMHAPNTRQANTARTGAVTTGSRRGLRDTRQTRRTAIEPLVPPNPNEFDNATSIFISRA